MRATDGCAIYKKQDDPLVENRWYGGVAPGGGLVFFGSQGSFVSLDAPTILGRGNAD